LQAETGQTQSSRSQHFDVEVGWLDRARRRKVEQNILISQLSDVFELAQFHALFFSRGVGGAGVFGLPDLSDCGRDFFAATSTFRGDERGEGLSELFLSFVRGG
jgi:hypothetical protein